MFRIGKTVGTGKAGWSWSELFDGRVVKPEMVRKRPAECRECISRRCDS